MLGTFLRSNLREVCLTQYLWIWSFTSSSQPRVWMCWDMTNPCNTSCWYAVILWLRLMRIFERKFIFASCWVLTMMWGSFHLGKCLNFCKGFWTDRLLSDIYKKSYVDTFGLGYSVKVHVVGFNKQWIVMVQRKRRRQLFTLTAAISPLLLEVLKIFERS